MILGHLDDRLQLASLNLEIGLDEVFARVALPSKAAAPTATEGP